MKLFGTLKKKQEGGFGKLVKKYETKHVDLNLQTGVFTYTNKQGTTTRNIPFRDIEEIYLQNVNQDGNCPKEFPYAFCFRCKKREFTFACKSKEERDQWLQSFQMLMEFRRIIQEQQQNN